MDTSSWVDLILSVSTCTELVLSLPEGPSLVLSSVEVKYLCSSVVVNGPIHIDVI